MTFVTYIIQIILFTFHAVFCVRRSCIVDECLYQFYTMLSYTRAVVMPPCNSRWNTIDRRPSAPVCVCVATYLVVMTNCLRIETANGKLLCCVWG